MKSISRFLPDRMSSLVRRILPIPGSSRFIRNIGYDLSRRRHISTKFLSYNTFMKCCVCLILIQFLSNSRLVKVCLRLLVAPDELCIVYCTHRVVSDRVHRLLVTLSKFRPNRFVQLLRLIPVLNLLLYLLVSIDLVYTGLRELVPE